MGEQERRQDSPLQAMPSLNGHNNNNNSSRGSGGNGSPLAEFDLGGPGSRSDTESPLLNVEPLPDADSQCPYCQKDFRKPRVLDCLHSMCEDCIIAQLDGRRDAQRAAAAAALNAQNSSTDCELEAPRPNVERHRNERPTPPGVIRCAICCQESHVGNDVRYVHSMLVDYVRLYEGDEFRVGETRLCRACKGGQTAVAWCRHCRADLCANCVQAHRDMNMFDGHQVLSYEEAEALGQPLRSSRAIYCPQHAQPMQLLCATCEALTCALCEPEHSQMGHKIMPVNDIVVDAIKKEIMNHANRVGNTWSEWLGKSRQEEGDRVSALVQQHETSRYHVERAFELYAEVLEKLKIKTLSDLDDAKERLEAHAHDLDRKIDLHQARVTDAVSFAQRLVDRAAEAEVVASRKKVLQQLTNLDHTMTGLNTHLELSFAPTPISDFERDLKNIIGIVTGRALAAKTKEAVEKAQTSTNWVDVQAWGTPATTPGNTRTLNNGSTSSSSASLATMTNNAATGNGLGAIGGERKNRGLPSVKSTGQVSATTTPSAAATPQANAADFQGGWPPSSVPPELPSPSPPKELPTPSATAALPLRPNDIYAAAMSGAAAAAAGFPWPPNAAAAAAAAASPVGAMGAVGAFPPALGSLGMDRLAGLPPHLQAQALHQAQLAQAMLFNKNFMLQRGIQPRDLFPFGLDNLGGLTGLAGVPGAHTRTSPSFESHRAGIEMSLHSSVGANGMLNAPSGFAVGKDDELLVADTSNHRIVIFRRAGSIKFGKPGVEDGSLCQPRKVMMLRGEPTRYAVLDRAASEQRHRVQIFNEKGDFVQRVNLALPNHGTNLDSVMVIVQTPTQGGIGIVDQSGWIAELKVEQSAANGVGTVRALTAFDGSSKLGDASDMAVHEKRFYIADYKNHCVQVFNSDGQHVLRLGDHTQTPYPIGVDIGESGDILVADAHGNHLHVNVYAPNGALLHTLTHSENKISRCTGLRLMRDNVLATLSRHSQQIVLFQTHSRSF